MMKRCYNCRRDLGDSGGIQCEKCKKNEEKYGKPERCKYCQVLAAFVNSKCVYCTHLERKIGIPIPCKKCGLKSAFTKTPDKIAFCRNCTATLDPDEKAKLKRETKPTTTNSITDIFAKKSRTSTTTSNNFPFTSNTSHLDQIQDLKDQISDLRSTIMQKDQTIMEKDQHIGKLKSTLMMNDKEHREALRQVHKRNETSMNTLKDQIRELSRQLDAARPKYR
uniref:Protein FAM76A n=1 Tax=Panagrolaimus sp. ES5 TaxID=591445 RepID=A0AC34FUM3_9BILA